VADLSGLGGWHDHGDGQFHAHGHDHGHDHVHAVYPHADHPLGPLSALKARKT
jgi:sirohydrochlorin cobaltochelatase